MGRHSRKGTQSKGPETEAAPGPGDGRRRRTPAAPPPGDGHVPFHDVPQVRGGHPEQHEPGGGWGTGPQQRYGDWQGAGRPGPGGLTPGQQAYAQRAVARQVSAQRAAQAAAAGRRTAVPPTAAGGPPLIPGPRREFVDAFDDGTVPAPRGGRYAAAAGAAAPPAARPGSRPGAPPVSPPGEAAERRESKGGKGRTFTGIAAAAVTTVLAVVVAGQVAQHPAHSGTRTSGVDRDGSQDASRSKDRPTPEAQNAQVKPLSYEAKMAMSYPFKPTLKASGVFEAVPGVAKAPGKGHTYRYRIDVEKGLGLDAGLFAEAVQKTLNDDRSWAHDGAMTFERVPSGKADFVITLASPGTTAAWCEKSGLDTTEDNVSCDSAATQRVVINAYRWAQGSSTFGPEKMMAYRQMLINHEVGHRLGHNHAKCATPGALAPVMQQQTKTLDIDGVKCRPNPWVFPAG